jgi:hypothetical protein
MTREQIRTFFERHGWTPREAGYQTVAMLGDTPEAAAEYLWDHVLGEPERPTLAALTAEASVLGLAV